MTKHVPGTASRKAKREAKKEGGTAAASSSMKVMKAKIARPVAMKVMKAIGRTAMKAMKRSPAEVPVCTKSSPCPKLGSGPMDYKGGRIYTSGPKKAFRVIRARGKYSTEAGVAWGKPAPTPQAWKGALKKIDVYKP